MHDSLVELIEASCRKFKERDIFGTKTSNGWEWLTYGDFKKRVDEVRGGLAARGVGAGDRVAIVANNCVEWATVAYATYGLGAVFVPMYTAQKPTEWRYILEDCGAKVVFAATNDIHDALAKLEPDLPELQHVIGLQLAADSADSYAALKKTGLDSPVDPVYPKPEDVAGFIYTSGTTGTPKGVILTHKNLCTNCAGVQPLFSINQERTLSFLPWAHSFGQTAELHYLVSGGHTLAINDDPQNLVSNLAVVRPTMLLAVPRIFNKIYDGVNRQMSEKPQVIQKLFRAGLKLAHQKSEGKNLDLVGRLTLQLAEKLIFSKVRQKFGGRLKLVISGSAALSKEVAEFIDALGIMVYEGYGLTETSPVVSVNFPGFRKIGSVGQAIPDVRIEIDETKSDVDGEGEILIHGPNVMRGYHNCPEETKAAIRDDGSFRTGDLGRLDGEGFLYITGRLKEQYKLENGKWVAPAPLEEQMKLSALVLNAMLYGRNRLHNVAIIVPDPVGLKDWANAEGLSVNDELFTSEKLHTKLLSEIRSVATRMKNYEQPRKLLVVKDEFTTENGMLTPSLKVKRRIVLEKYGDQLNALY